MIRGEAASGGFAAWLRRLVADFYSSIPGVSYGLRRPVPSLGGSLSSVEARVCVKANPFFVVVYGGASSGTPLTSRRGGDWPRSAGSCSLARTQDADAIQCTDCWCV